MTKQVSREFMADNCDHRAIVGEIIQKHFFPYPPTTWHSMSPMQRDEFLACADEIMAALKRYAWRPTGTPQ